MPPTKRKLAAILAADAVGYSALIGQDEDGAIATLKGHLDALEPVIGLHRGRIVDMAGDGFLAQFGSALEAVSCGAEMQGKLAERNRQQPEAQRMGFRMGVHVGAIVVDGEKIRGDTVNIAARLEAMADPGGMLISQPVHDGVVGRIDLDFIDNGERRFKNIAQPIRVWSWPQRLPDVRAAGKPRVFVADFEGRGDGESRLANDLGDELRAHLARLTGLEVATDRRDAHYVLDGSVRLTKGRSRVFGRLTDVDGARQIWSDRFDQDTDDPFEILDHCAPGISMSVRRRVATDDAARVSNMDLDELSLEQLLAVSGVNFFKPTKAGWGGGGRIAEKALELAPDNYMALAMAAAGLGAEEYLYGFRKPADEVIDVAFARIRGALRENNRSDMLHVTNALLLLHARRRYQDSIAASRRALDLNPDFNMGYWMLAAGQVFMGDYGAGAETAMYAAGIDIRDPYVHLYSRVAGYGHFGAARHEDAADWFQRADFLSPGLLPNLCGLAVSRWLVGDQEGARDAVARLVGEEPEFRVSEMEPLPFRDNAMWTRFAETLLKAGAPA